MKETRFQVRFFQDYAASGETLILSKDKMEAYQMVHSLFRELVPAGEEIDGSFQIKTLKGVIGVPNTFLDPEDLVIEFESKRYGKRAKVQKLKLNL